MLLFKPLKPLKPSKPGFKTCLKPAKNFPASPVLNQQNRQNQWDQGPLGGPWFRTVPGQADFDCNPALQPRSFNYSYNNE
jgi:hypothetical protein